MGWRFLRLMMRTFVPSHPSDKNKDVARVGHPGSWRNERGGFRLPLTMPSSLKRYQQSGDFHFLTFSCYHRSPYLATAESCDRFEQALEQIRKRYVFHIFGYVVMPEHVHLLVSEPSRATLARAVQALKTSVSKQSKETPFWQVRYYDFNVFSGAKRTEKLR